MQYDDDRIDALVRAMRRDGAEPAAAIPAEVVHAYLTGRATAAQKTEVRRALSASPQFRSELIDLANYLETLSSDAAASAYDAAAAPAFVPEVAVSASARAATPSRWRQFVAAIEDRLTMPRILVAVPALTVAVMVVSLLPRMSRSPLVSPESTTSVAASRFMVPPGTSRGEGEIEPELAALRALHDCVRAREDGWEVGAPTQIAPGTPLATVHLVDAWRRRLRTVAITLPNGAPLPDASPTGGTAGGEVRVWVLELPDAGATPGSLRAFALPASASMALRADGASKRCVLVATYASDGRYYASPCIPLSTTE